MTRPIVLGSVVHHRLWGKARFRVIAFLGEGFVRLRECSKYGTDLPDTDDRGIVIDVDEINVYRVGTVPYWNKIGCA